MKTDGHNNGTPWVEGIVYAVIIIVILSLVGAI